MVPALEMGQDRLPLDRRRDAAASTRRLDPSSRPACGRLRSDSRWLLHQLGANWQWLSCTAFYAQYNRCYSQIAFPKKTDLNGDYVRHFCPELKDIPAKYIYEPSKCPIQDQKKAKCLIKGDEPGEEDGMKTYPKPMFDFNERRTICINGMKNAYHVGLYGNSKEVLGGTWKKLFDDNAEGPTEGKQDEGIGGNAQGDLSGDADDAEGGSKSSSHQKQTGPQTPQKRKGQGTLEGQFRGGKGKKPKV